MIFLLHRPKRQYRRLSPVLGYILHDRRLTSRAIPVVMNDELKDMQAARRVRMGGAK